MPNTERNSPDEDGKILNPDLGKSKTHIKKGRVTKPKSNPARRSRRVSSYMAFLKEYRIRHNGISGKKQICDGAKIWKTLSQAEKDMFKPENMASSHEYAKIFEDKDKTQQENAELKLNKSISICSTM